MNSRAPTAAAIVVQPPPLQLEAELAEETDAQHLGQP